MEAGQGVRHWLKPRPLHKVHAWRRVESSSVWLWGKEQSINSAKATVYTKGDHPLLLDPRHSLLLGVFLFHFWGKEYSLKLASRTYVCNSSLHPLIRSCSTHTCGVRTLQKRWRGDFLNSFYCSFIPGYDSFPKGILAAGIRSSKQKLEMTQIRGNSGM